MKNQLLVIHVAKNNASSDNDDNHIDMIVEGDYEMLNFLSKDKKIQKRINNNELSIVVIDQNNIH